MGIMKWATDGRINSIQVQLVLLVDYIVYKSLQTCSAGRALNFSLRDTLEHIWRSLGKRPTEMSSPKLGVEIISTLLICNVKECESSVCTPVEEENERNGGFKEGLKGRLLCEKAQPRAKEPQYHSLGDGAPDLAPPGAVPVGWEETASNNCQGRFWVKGGEEGLAACPQAGWYDCPAVHCARSAPCVQSSHHTPFLTLPCGTLPCVGGSVWSECQQQECVSVCHQPTSSWTAGWATWEAGVCVGIYLWESQLEELPTGGTKRSKPATCLAAFELVKLPRGGIYVRVMQVPAVLFCLFSSVNLVIAVF